jgi:hypothetical protein
VFLPALAFALALAWCGTRTARAQGATQAAGHEGPDYEVQLYLLVGSNDSGRGGEVPRQLDGVVRQLKSSLPFAGYRLGATFLDRVRNAGSLDVSGVAASPLVSAPPLSSNTPSFYQFKFDARAADEAGGQRFVNLSHFYFGLKVPIQTATVGGEGGKGGSAVIQYESTGINTQLTVPEGEPTVVGTLTTSRPDEGLVLVIVIKRAGR